MIKWLCIGVCTLLLVGCQAISAPAPDAVGWQWSYSAGDYIRSRPVVTADTVYIGSDDNRLHAIGLYSGAALWQYQTGDNVTGVTADEDGVYFGSWDGTIYAVAKSGKLRWQYQTTGWVSAAPVLHQVLHQDALFVGSHNHVFYALSSQSGEPLWQYQMNGPIESSAVVAGELVIVGSTDGYLHALDIESGQRVWHFRTGGGIIAPPVLAEENLYFGTLDRRFYSLHATTGQVRWRFDAAGAFAATPTVTNGVVFLASDARQIYALRTADGTVLWQQSTEDLVHSSLTVWSDLLFVGTDGGTLLALDVASGRKMWRYQVGGMIAAGPTIASDVLYVGSTVRQLQAIVLQTGASQLIHEQTSLALTDELTDEPHVPPTNPLPNIDANIDANVGEVRVASQYEDYVQLWAAQATMPSIDAVQSLQDVIAFRPYSGAAFEAHVTLARYYARHSEPAAEEAYRAALALEDDDALRLELARHLEAQGNLAAAYEEYHLLLGRRPDAFAGMRRTGVDPLLVAKALNDAAFYSDAYETLEGMDDPGAQLLRGQALLGLGRYDEALAAYQAALDANPQDATARFGFALALAWVGRGEEALAQYALVDSAESRQNQAQLLAAEEPDQAIALYVESPNPSAWWSATLLLESQGRLTETLPLYARLAATTTRYTDDAAYRLYILGQRLDDAAAQAEGEERLAELGLNWLALRSTGEALHLPFAAPVDVDETIMAKVEMLEAVGHAELAHRELTVAARFSAKPEVDLAVARALVARGHVVEAQEIAEQYIRQDAVAPRSFWELSYPRPYSATVTAAAAEFDVDPLLVWAVMREESRFAPDARSFANARGLMQVIPPTQAWIAEAIALELAPGDAYVPETSIRMGAWLLSFLIDYFDGDVELAILAYNAGAGSVEFWLAEPNVANRDDLYRWIGYSETRLYLKRVGLSYEVYRALYGAN